MGDQGVGARLGAAGDDARPRVWPVGQLCQAIADALQARFNPVTVRGEISNFSRAASGHCYFTVKDEQGQLRCAMFRRAAMLVAFTPRDGEQVELRGRVDVYGPRGDLQLIVESLTRGGQGGLFEEFLRLKAKLEAEGLFDPVHKRAPPRLPRAIGVVTSLGAAALHDVVTALQRRVPHIPVVVAAAAVQGAGAAAEVCKALSILYQYVDVPSGLKADLTSSFSPPAPVVDVILLVRGGGAMEDLWAFNDEQLARTIRQSPVPLIAGIGHETDFTLADFVADVRAPTPTAAAEMAALPLDDWRAAVDGLANRLHSVVVRQVDRKAQRLDGLAGKLGRPSLMAVRHRMRLAVLAQQIQRVSSALLREKRQRLALADKALPASTERGCIRAAERLHRAELRLGLLDPTRTLQRGYAWLLDDHGEAVTQARATHTGQHLRAVLMDGEVDLTVNPRRPI